MDNKSFVDDIFNFSVADALAEVKKAEERRKRKEKIFTMDELNMTLNEFWDKYSDNYEDGYHREEKHEDSRHIPLKGFLSYFNEGLDKEIVYCSVFRWFDLIKQKNGFYKVVGITDDYVCKDIADYKLNVKGDSKLSNMLDKIFKKVKQDHIDLMKAWKKFMDSDRCEFYVEDYHMSEFIIRNADKYGIDYYYLGSGDADINICSIKNEWI